jgi:hypothetical protein
MRKKPAQSVQTILPIVHKLEILPTASPLLSSSVIRNFVTIGAIIHRRKLVGEKSIITNIRELTLREKPRDTTHVSTGVFTSIRIIMESVV